MEPPSSVCRCSIRARAVGVEPLLDADKAMAVGVHRLRVAQSTIQRVRASKLPR